MTPTGHSDEDRLRRLIDTGRSLVSELDLETVLQRLLEAARDLTGAEYAALGVLDPERNELERFLTVGIDEHLHGAIGDLPRGRGVLGVLISEPAPLRLADVGRHPRSYGFPQGHPPMQSFLGVPILVRGKPYGNVYLTEKRGGGDFDAADEETAVVLADWAAIAIDNARAYAGLERRQVDLERAVATFEETTRIARAVAGEVDLDRILELIVKRGRALVDARAALVMLERGGDLVVAAVTGDLDDDLVGMRFAVDGCVAGDVLRTARPERLADAPGRLRFGLGEQTGARTALLVPLVFRGRSLGVLAAFDRTHAGPAFTAWDEHVLGAFAASAASAVATAQDVAIDATRRRIEAQEQERRRWARELHDETLQELAVLKLLAGAALRASSDEERTSVLRQIGDSADVATYTLRALITDLRPAALDDSGLGAALDALVERMAHTHDLAIDLDVTGLTRTPADRPPRAVEDTVYRIVQEALANVAKHARADRAQVTVSQADDRVEIRIHDDGAGFDVDAEHLGFGLVGMRERAGLVDGVVTIDSTKDTGTTIFVIIPITGAQDVDGQRRAAQ